MKQYVLDNKIINATEKAFNVVYKAQGYVPYKSTKRNDNKANKSEKKENNKVDIEELRTKALEKNISFTEETTAEELIVLISEKEGE